MSINHIDPNLQEQLSVLKFCMIQILPSGLENSEEPYHILRLLLSASMILLRDTWKHFDVLFSFKLYKLNSFQWW